jgi:hypothetical protein
LVLDVALRQPAQDAGIPAPSAIGRRLGSL